MKNLVALLLLVCLIFSCEASETPAPAPYQQWSIPFAGVPEREDAVIYQVNIRSFSTEGNFEGVEARLDEIQALGANVLYLMPIYPVGQVRSAGGLGSPYAVKDYKAVNPDFGDLEDLRSLVNEAHSRGMAVILDWVANHTSWDNAWITEHKDWYQQDASGNIIIPPNTNWQDVAQLDYSNEELRKAMIDAMQYWVYTANIDGFRFDAANWVPFDFWKQAVSELRAIDTHKLLLLAEGDRSDHFEAGFDYIFGFNFFYTLKEQVFMANRSVSLLQQSHVREYDDAIDETQRVVRYISNHDVNIYEGTPQELFGSKQAALAAFVVAAYMKSVPMIYNGQEIGYPRRLEFFSRTPIDWSLADEEVLAEYKKIISFYQSSEAIRNGAITFYSGSDVVAFTREHEGEKVLVLSNLRGTASNYIVPAALEQTQWKNAFSGATTTLSQQLNLAPFAYMVLKNQ